jgi:uncharacterized protein (TIGR02145 family)
MTVYNTNDNTKGGKGQGIYTWNGTWIYSGGAPKATTPVSRIVITSPDNVNIIKYNEILQLTANVLPADASNQNLTWAVLWGTSGKATVDDTGLVTPIKPGAITVRASAIDGSNAYRDFPLTIQATEQATGISIYSETNADTVPVGSSLVLLSNITPISAYPLVKWSVRNITGSALVATATSETGVISGQGKGTVMVRAETIDGSNKADSVEIRVTRAILPKDTATLSIGDQGPYLTYKFENTTWMVENSREAGWVIQYDRGNGQFWCYYMFSSSNNGLPSTVCPDGWSVPTVKDANNLADYLNTRATSAERNLWFEEKPGYYYDATKELRGIGSDLRVYTSTWNTYLYHDGSKWLTATWGEISRAGVRCIKN